MIEKDKNSTSMSFTGILVQTIMRWKIILLCAVLGFVGMGFKNYREQSASVVSASNAKASYEMSDVDKISMNVTDSIAARIKYLKDSYIVSLKPGESYEASSVLFVSDGAEDEYTMFNNHEDTTSKIIAAVNTKTGAILSALSEYVDANIDYSSLYDDFDMDEDLYFQDLVNCTIQGSSLVINTIADKPELADSLMNTVVDQIDKKFNQIVDQMQVQEYKVMTISNEPAVSAYPQEFPTLQKVNNELRDLVSMQQTLTDSQADLAKRAVPVHESISKKEMLKSGIKGGILGFGGSAVIVIVYLILKGKLLSAKEVEEGLDLKVLAVQMPKYGNKEIKGLSKKFICLDSLYHNIPSFENSLALVDDYLKQKGAKDIAIVCDVKNSADVHEVMMKLNKLHSGITYHVAVRPNEDLNERKKLQSVDGVVMLGVVSKSKLADIQNLKTLMKDYNKPVLGAIVM